MVAYVNKVAQDNQGFRANLSCVFLIENTFRLFAYGYTGILTQQVVWTALLLAPAVVIGMKLGFKLYHRWDEAFVRKLVIGLLLVSGTLLSVRNMGFLLS